MALRAECVAVVGLGLIGGSLARALRERGFSRRFIGCGHRAPSLQRGVELGIIDSYTLDIEEALARADILVLAAPTLVTEALLLAHSAGALERRECAGDYRCGERQGQSVAGGPGSRRR